MFSLSHLLAYTESDNAVIATLFEETYVSTIFLK